MGGTLADLNAFFDGRRVLVTGGLGFLGSGLTLRLVECGAQVTVIDNLNPLYGGNRFNIAEVADRIEVVLDDVRNLDVMQPLIARSETMFHLAAQVSYIDLSMPCGPRPQRESHWASSRAAGR